MSKSNTNSTIKPPITFNILAEEIAARTKLTEEVIASFRLEGIELDQETLDKFNAFDTQNMSAEEALQDFYDELNAIYGTKIKPPKS